jgi:spore coat polysaccharide biosynthesis protein SpsF (cytidylyltransferase family)
MPDIAGVVRVTNLDLRQVRRNKDSHAEKLVMSATVAIIQARMTSSRLPGKVLMDIAGQPALTRMITRLRSARRIDQIVVATTTNATDDPIVSLSAELGIQVWRGDEMDVLGRYAGAAVNFNADPVVRLTSDCPMIDPEIVDAAIKMFESGDWDYVSNGIHRTYPDGLDVEVFSRAALNTAAEEAHHPFCREHVTPYIHGGKPDIPHGEFRIGKLIFDADFAHVRWTLDNADDLDRIQRLIALLPEGYSWMEALAVATKTPDLLGPAP